MSIKNDEKYFIRNVKNYMVENKISNGKMAKKMGVSTSNVASTLNGTFDISMNFVRRVSEATGMSIPKLFSPDPKQYGSAVEGDVQDGNAVAMMELMKKQMEELKRENERLSDENDARLEDVKDMEEASQIRIELEGRLRKHIAELEKENENLKKRHDSMADENLRLNRELDDKKVESAEPLNLSLHINTVELGDDYMYTDFGRITVDDVVEVNPMDKKVTLKVYFDEIHIK